MSDISREQIDAMLAVLRDFPASGKLHNVDRDVATNLVLYGFVARHEVEKPCPACGKPRFDYDYFKPSPAGRAILAWADGAASGTLTEGGDAKQAPGESLSGPTPAGGDAQ